MHVPEEVKIETEHVTLGQLLKRTGVIGTGGEAKMYLSETRVHVNGQIEDRRGRKLYDGDTVQLPVGRFVIRR